MSDDKPLHVQLAAGLRAFADMIEQNPETADGFRYTLTDAAINVHLADGNEAEQQAMFARVALRHGAKVTKDINDTWHNLIIDFGGVKAQVLAYREEVCERVVTGTETVTKTVPDPKLLAEVPTIEVTEKVETYEWQCKPLLAGGAS
ncbi:hypothetical protein [Amycolatopsis sp. NPDC059657]|uniref:hypothetical protein n=1 Tax=Amycolatopsis sp. NPDC059657 TaxID=3346899 RepID=UPI003670331C